MEQRESFFKIREDLSPQSRFVLGASCVALFLLLWVACTWGEAENRVFSPIILPSPMEILQAFVPLHWDMGLMRATLFSLGRVTVGFFLAAAVAIPIGIFMGAYSKVGAFLGPMALFGGYVPVVTLIPLTIAWFSLGELQKIGFLFIGTFVFLLPLVVKTIMEVDDIFLQTGYTLGANRWQTIRYVLIPCAKSRIFNHLRLFYGVGWGYIILAEMSELDRPGLGALISISQRRSMTDRVFAVLLVIVVIAIGVDSLLKRLGRALFPYEEEV